MRRLFWMIVVVAAATAGLRQVIAQTQPSAPQAETFAIIYQPGPNWIKGRSIYDQDLYAHGQYMAKLLEQSHLQLGGPFSDSSGGMAIITAKDADEAASILKNDPSIAKGVFVATVRPWDVVFRK